MARRSRRGDAGDPRRGLDDPRLLGSAEVGSFGDIARAVTLNVNGGPDGSCGRDRAPVRPDQRWRYRRVGELLVEDFVEHEEMPRLEPSKEGVKQLFHMYRAAFPDLRMEVQDVLVSGDKAVARVRATGTRKASSWACPPARASTSS